MNKEKIWEEIIETTKYRYTRRDGEMTAREFAERSDISRKVAQRILAELVEDGTLSVREAILDGAVTFLYAPKA